MEQIVDPSSLAFFALAISFVVRIRQAIRVPAARLTWIASGVGAVALLCCGTLVPLPVLDGWLGGTNYVSLVQNVAAAFAFWLVANAVVTQGRHTLHQLLDWRLSLGILAFMVPFFFIDRGTTARDFMFESSDQFAGFLYSSFYLALIAGICAYLVVKIWESGSRSFATLHLGGALVTLGCVLQIVTLASVCFAWLPASVNNPIYMLALTSFSTGVVLMAGNMAGLAIMRLRSTLRVKRSIESVEQILHQKGLEVQARPALTQSFLNEPDAISHLYEGVIAVTDLVQAEGAKSLNDEEKKQVTQASHIVSRRMFGEARGRVRYPRLERAIVKWATTPFSRSR